ncbi:DUF3341 domain-containing protein [Consotaella salsifontis]|uniref:Quinol:cytochrome c oxidoreductase membrane protein n=1 Tax=Consotaella salsifontis TaxID=1365950 RepID=A0A1T4PNL6_9HYPH|nr:DUF3341 domain-containing protein [Consotaella salsifontis]SJZ93039.1 quinol:cytochrome c oxidoreductase membrane protein [Consotaella salsifontis]
MTLLLAEFDSARSLLDAARQTREASTFRVIDAFSPFAVEGLAEEIEGFATSPVRPAMLAGGIAGGAFGLFLQWYSAAIALPIMAGGRPFASWPDFFFVTFEMMVFGAATTGFVVLLWSCGLPRLHHPIFDAPDFERATQDRFFLEVDAGKAADRAAARQYLHALGALSVSEVET